MIKLAAGCLLVLMSRKLIPIVRIASFCRTLLSPVVKIMLPRKLSRSSLVASLDASGDPPNGEEPILDKLGKRFPSKRLVKHGASAVIKACGEL